VAVPEVKKIKITTDMEFIFMASDGVWECVNEEDLCKYISFTLKWTNENKISNFLTYLFDKISPKESNQKGSIGRDNMSCILIKFDHSN